MSIDSVKATTAVGKVGAWDWMDRVGTRVHCASLGRKTTRSSSLSSGMVQPPKYPGGTPYNGLYGEAPPETDTFYRLQVYGFHQLEINERVGKFVAADCERT